jgi:magnesium transporter
MRDAITALMTMESHFDVERRLLLRSTLDHVIRLTDQLDSERMMASEISDIALAMVNVRIGEVTRLLTVVATIFIPMTFLASVYGMNFRVMPELEFRFGYPIALGAMALTAIGSLMYFKRRGWLRRSVSVDEPEPPSNPPHN